METELRFLVTPALQALLDKLQSEGYETWAPVDRDGAIVLDRVATAEQMAQGLVDEQAPGRYELQSSGQSRYFDWANGPQALKPLLFQPEEILWRAHREADGVRFAVADADPPARAVIGVRACDLAALELHDRHFLKPGSVDPAYQRRRERLFLVAVNCSRSAATCFCTATGDGPAVDEGHDLALTELDGGFLVAAGSPTGEKLLAGLPTRPASADEITAGSTAVAAAAAMQNRRLPPVDLAAVLPERFDHPRWQAVAERCLACGNCTAVCPSCFCFREMDRPALDLSSTEHLRIWDSCFSQQHSAMAGFVVRGETGQRYRQWLTHKFAWWHAQYGRSGCTGCGRCISWCPVGIDVTEELEALSG